MRGPSLPIDAVLEDVVDAVTSRGGVVLRAPTGAGKTTRVGPALLDAGIDGRIVMLEPRRVAARAAARRISAERGGRLGEEIGYQIRFERKASRSTRLLVVTEGVLLRMLQDDPFLEGVGAVLFDEFHERSLPSDLALALTARVRASGARDDLRIVVMSATLDPVPVAAFLGGVPVVESEGRAFAVEIVHRPASEEIPLERRIRSAVLEAVKEGKGDVLVFLPGVGEIRRASQALQDTARALDVEVLELHGELPPERQDAAIETGKRRRVILSTNVAETSLTIPGVRVVIDAGWERVPRLDPAVGMARLEKVRISRESAEQRAGRAGRTAAGRCIRLWAPSEEVRFAAHREPEIRRADLAGAALQLHAWGESDLRRFPFFERPPDAALNQAEALLETLGALDGGRLTDVGRRMAALPLHPRLARLLVQSSEVGHADRLSLAAALLSERSPFVRVDPRTGVEHHSPSDVLDGVEALEAFQRSGRLDVGWRTLRRGPARQALRVRDQLLRLLGRAARDRKGGRAGGGDADEAVLRAVHAAYADRLARRRGEGDERAVMVGGRGVRLGSSSAVRESDLFVCVDVDAGHRGERAEAWVRAASVVERAWLPAEAVREEDRLRFDGEREAVVGTRRTLYGEDLVLDEVAIGTPRGGAAERVLVEAARRDLVAALGLDAEGVATFRTRVTCLRAWRPALDLPALDDAAVEGLLPTLARGKRSFAQLRKAPLLESLRGLFTWDQLRRLDVEAPERIEVPSGNRIRLRYEVGRPPVLAVRIQEVFGLKETPRVAGGRVKVLMHLLAPNHRPQQITDDMPSFWANTYPGVRAELKRRYPRHAWPEDPRTAQPERRPKRRPKPRPKY